MSEEKFSLVFAYPFLFYLLKEVKKRERHRNPQTNSRSADVDYQASGQNRATKRTCAQALSKTK